MIKPIFDKTLSNKLPQQLMPRDLNSVLVHGYTYQIIAGWSSIVARTYTLVAVYKGETMNKRYKFTTVEDNQHHYTFPEEDYGEQWIVRYTS